MPRIKLIEKNEAAERQPFTISNISAALSKATGLDWDGIRFDRVIYAVNRQPDAKKTISVDDAFKALEAGKQAAKGAGWRACDEPYFPTRVVLSKGSFGNDVEFKTFDEYKKWAGENPKAADVYHVFQISLALRDGLKKAESPASEARRYNYGAMTKDDFVRSASDLYLKSLKRRKIDPEDGYEIEDLMDTLSDSGLYLKEWVIAHIGLPKGEDKETYDAWMDDRPKVNAVIDAIMHALEEKGYSVE